MMDGSSYKEKTFFVEGDKKIELLFFLKMALGSNPLGAAKTKDKKENIQLAFSFNLNMLKDS